MKTRGEGEWGLFLWVGEQSWGRDGVRQQSGDVRDLGVQATPPKSAGAYTLRSRSSEMCFTRSHTAVWGHS